MSQFQRRLLDAVKRCPGGGPCNFWDFVGGGNSSQLQLRNIERSLDVLRKQGWINDQNYLTESAERFLVLSSR